MTESYMNDMHASASFEHVVRIEKKRSNLCYDQLYDSNSSKIKRDFGNSETKAIFSAARCYVRANSKYVGEQ